MSQATNCTICGEVAHKRDSCSCHNHEGGLQPTAAKHTPGPWRVGEYQPLAIGFGGEFDKPGKWGFDQIADVDCSSSIPDEVKRANARLIAAAPELLAALYDLVVWQEKLVLASHPMVERQWASEYREAMGRVRAAIARAEGRQDA